MMHTEAKHGLPKVVALADKLARLVLDQVEKDRGINLENIRNALVGPLAQDAMDRVFEASIPGGRPGMDGANPDLRQAVCEARNGQLVMWQTRADGHRYAVKPTRALLQAFGDAIASGHAQRVSISDGTYVLPDGEVLTEREMILRSGTDGRR